MSREFFRRQPQRPKLNAFRTGDIFIMAAGSTRFSEPKSRPHVLLTRCNPSEFGVLAYGSTQATESAWAAVHMEVPPRPHGVTANGLRAKTYFYPGIMVPTAYDVLPPHIGILDKAKAGHQQVVRNALGIGSGTCTQRFAPARSRRGRIVVLAPHIASAVDTRYAAILGEHLYSRECRYQVIVPLLRGDNVLDEPRLLRVQWQQWFAVFGEPTDTALLAVTAIQSVWQADDIVHETPFVIDDASMKAVEERLCARFELEAVVYE